MPPAIDCDEGFKKRICKTKDRESEGRGWVGEDECFTPKSPE